MGSRGARPGARRVVVEARAKLNLGLAVGPRRGDGYHDLVTVFQSVSLADTLIAAPARTGFTLRVRYQDVSMPRGAPAGVSPARATTGGADTVGATPARRAAPSARAARRLRVSAGPSNLVLRAARLLAARTGLSRGARFTLVKRIPPGAGLGGGSADAAAAIAALAALHGLRLPRMQRLRLAAELGADVPFAMLGGTALGLGRGDRLTRLRLARPIRALIAVPPWRVSTVRAFARLDRVRYGLTAWKGKLRFAQNFRRKRLKPEQALGLGNTLEEVLGDRRQDFLSLCARLRAAGVDNVRMTGSGSAVFAILGPGTPAKKVAHRFAGSESLYLVRSTQAARRLITLP